MAEQAESVGHAEEHAPPPVMIMAAGRGERLAPWTNEVPKPALPVANEPCLSHLLRQLARQGFRKVVVNASHRADVLQGVIGDGTPWGVDLTWSVEDAPRGTAGGIRGALPSLAPGDGPLVVCSGDGLHDINVAAVVAAHRHSGAALSIVLTPVDDPRLYGVAVLDGERITDFVEKPATIAEAPSHLCNTGVYVFSPTAIEYIARGSGSDEPIFDIAQHVIPALQADGHALHGVIHDGYWNDIGNEAAWLAANAHAARAADDTGVVVHPSAQIAADVTLTAPCVVGEQAVVGRGATLNAAVVLPYARIDDAEQVAHCIRGTVAGLAQWAAAQIRS